MRTQEIVLTISYTHAPNKQIMVLMDYWTLFMVSCKDEQIFTMKQSQVIKWDSHQE